MKLNMSFDALEIDFYNDFNCAATFLVYRHFFFSIHLEHFKYCAIRSNRIST